MNTGICNQIVPLSQGHDVGDFESRCRSLGIPLLQLDENNRICRRYAGDGQRLTELVAGSSMLEGEIQKHISDWQGQISGMLTELWPGCWVLPIALIEYRRVVGTTIAVFVTNELLSSEEFCLLCSQEQVDYDVAVAYAQSEKFTSREEMIQHATMLKWMYDDLKKRNQYDDEIGSLSERLGDVYEEISLFYKLSAQMSVNQEPRHLLEVVCAELCQLVDVRWIAVHIIDTDESLHSLQGELVTAGDIPCKQEEMGKIGRRLLNEYLHEGGAIVCYDVLWRCS